MNALSLVTAMWLVLCALWLRHLASSPPKPCRSRAIEPATARHNHRRRKPEWVTRQLILLKAHLPQAGCRTLAITFNRVFAHREVSVSKSFVHRALLTRALEIATARKAIKSATPRSMAPGQCWGLDLTGRADEAGHVHTVLGLIDHGSRMAVRLARVPHKCGWTLLGHLCLAIAACGKPRSIRTDNERCFTGRIFSAGLRLLGIRHQRTDLHCPWQNGRIERLFGTLKGVLRQLVLADGMALDALLRDFSRWYNQLRPHQALGGMTPEQALEDTDPYQAYGPRQEIQFVEGWGGLLAGFRMRQ